MRLLRTPWRPSCRALALEPVAAAGLRRGLKTAYGRHLPSEVRAQCLANGMSEARLKRTEAYLRRPPGALALRLNTAKGGSITEARDRLQAYCDEEAPGAEVIQWGSERTLLIKAAPVEDLGPDWGLSSVLMGRQCGEAMLCGSHGYAAGIGATTKHLAPSASINVFGDSTNHLKRGGFVSREALQEASQCRYIGRGHAHMGRAQMLAKQAAGVAVSMLGRRFPPLHDCPLLQEGLLYLQSMPAQLAAQALCEGLPAGARVLDLCASPGGKASAIADWMVASGNTGSVVACDRSQRKVDIINQLAAQLGLQEVLSAHMQSAAEPWQGEPLYEAVMLDPPCSALGLRPSLSFPGEGGRTIEELNRYQRAMVHRAVAALRTGGTLVYSTCTITPLENELMVQYVLDTFPGMRLVDCGVPLGRGCALPVIRAAGDGGLAIERTSVERSDTSGQLKGGDESSPGFTADCVGANSNSNMHDAVRRFEPGCAEDLHDTYIGFFICKFVKDPVGVIC